MGTYTKLLELDKKKTELKASSKTLPQKKTPPTAKESVQKKQASNEESNIASKQAINIASNIAILQEDVQSLRVTPTTQRTFRLTKEEIDWLIDTSYQLSKGFIRGKVSQVDILRIGLKLFKNLLPKNRKELIELLEAIK